MCLTGFEINFDIPPERKSGKGWKVCRVTDREDVFNNYWKYFCPENGGMNDYWKGCIVSTIKYVLGKPNQIRSKNMIGESSPRYLTGIHLYKTLDQARIDWRERMRQGQAVKILACSYSQAVAEDKDVIVARRIVPEEVVD